MTNSGIVNIHGKDYMTVARRVELAHEDGLLTVESEVLQHSPVVVVKALITTKKGTYTGISSANPMKAIEKSNPYEVAETSAVGRALGFAGYGIIEGIPSADEMHKAIGQEESFTREPIVDMSEPTIEHPYNEKRVCPTCKGPATQKSGVNASGKAWSGIFCDTNKDHPVSWI